MADVQWRGAHLGAPIFAYGTLLRPDIQRAVIGREVAGEPGLLDGYRRYRVAGADYPAIARSPGAHVEGLVYRGLTVAELGRIDDYEGEVYFKERVAVSRGSANTGTKTLAYAYVIRDEHRHLLLNADWHPRRGQR